MDGTGGERKSKFRLVGRRATVHVDSHQSVGLGHRGIAVAGPRRRQVYVGLERH